MNGLTVITKWFGLDRPGRMDTHVRAILARGLADQLDALGSRRLRISLHEDERQTSGSASRAHRS